MAHSAIYTGTMTASTWVQDFSPLVLAPPIPGGELKLWDIIPKAADGFEPTKYEWVEEAQDAVTLALTTNIDNTTATTITCTAAGAAAVGLRTGSLLVNSTDSTKTEVIHVSAYTNGATTFTAVRDYGGFVSGSGGGTTGQAHTSGDYFKVLPTHVFEGSGVTSTDAFPWRDRTLAYNYYSLVSEHTRVSGSDLVREYRGSTPSNWTYQVDGIVQQMARRFDYLVLRSPQKARGASDVGSMGGLTWYATQTTNASTYCYSTSATTFSYETFDDACLAKFNQGSLEGANWVMIMPPTGAQVIPYIHESAMRMDYAKENVRGYFANSLMTTINGARIPVVVSSSLPSDSFLLLNLDAVKLHFLRGRALKVYNKPLGEGMDDYVAQRWISELTMEFQRPLENCYYHTGITYTRPS